MFIRTRTRTRESLKLLTPNTNMAPSYSYFSFQENFDHTTTDIRITLSFNILQVWSIPKNRDFRAHPTNPVGDCADANPKLLPNDT